MEQSTEDTPVQVSHSLTPAAAVPGSSCTSPAPLNPLQHINNMAAELDNRCPICLETWEEASYVMPCLHQFCYTCIRRWAESKPECPLCKRKLTSILHSVKGDNDFQEYVISRPAAPSPVTRLTGEAPGHRAVHNLQGPATSEPSAGRPVPRPPVGGLHLHTWALLFRQHPVLLRHLVLWLRWQLRLIFHGARREVVSAQRLIMSNLSLFGPDEETLCQLLQATLGPHTRSFIRQLVDTVVERCSREAQRRMELGDNWAAEEQEGSPEAAPEPAATQRGSPVPRPAPSSSPDRSEAEELPGTSVAALRGGPGGTGSVPVPTHGEQEQPQEDSEESEPASSTPSRDNGCSLGRARRAPKRRAGSPEATRPNKRPPHPQQ
ncbi:hypothetical protein AV530_002589 [Patagioenas fasciata monilis]|uniref:E3 ubiquitin-protein ligase Topors n=1 Tax=Patagioenas fasciata monilis TaxID=372326 RepID=A0A1V4K6Y8_PATFA|nr:hypothetical protein AV530_002589 [Patagioenas fasciata monilis]